VNYALDIPLAAKAKGILLTYELRVGYY